MGKKIKDLKFTLYYNLNKTYYKPIINKYYALYLCINIYALYALYWYAITKKLSWMYKGTSNRC